MMQWYLRHSKLKSTTYDQKGKRYNLFSESSGPVTKYDVTITLTNGQSTTGKVKENKTYSTILLPNVGYLPPATISVTIGGTATQNYTYDSVTGLLTIQGTYVVDDIAVVGSCVPAIYTGAELGRAILGTMILGAE